MSLGLVRRSAPALALAALGWATGCATVPHPMIDPGYAAGAYTPGRITVLPPDVFVILDQVGDNDPAQSAALGQQVSATTVRAIEQALRSRGYDVDLSSRWDGIYGRDGSLLVTRDDLGAIANSVLTFANSPDGGGAGVMTTPRVVAPELAARIGWATQSNALLYVNVKGAVTTSGKRAASIIAGVFIVFIVIAVIAVLIASQKNGGGGGAPGLSGSGTQSVTRAAPVGGGWRGAPASAGGGAWRGAPASGAAGAWRGSPSSGAAAAGGAWRGSPAGAAGPVASAPVPAASGGAGWRGGGTPGPLPRGAPVYRSGGGGGGFGVGLGIGVVVPLDGPTYTHDGSVGYDDPVFAGDELYVSMTLVSTYDGRVLWHVRDQIDLDADQPPDVERMVHTFLDTLPPARPPAR